MMLLGNAEVVGCEVEDPEVVGCEVEEVLEVEEVASGSKIVFGWGPTSNSIMKETPWIDDKVSCLGDNFTSTVF